MSMNSDLYGNYKPDTDNFLCFHTFKSFYEKEILESEQSIIDIGGADGKFIEVINRFIAPVNGTVLEVDMDCIKIGKDKYPHIKFIKHRPQNKKYDFVTMNSLFPQLLDWKKTLLKMEKLSNKYIVFDALLRNDGSTIADDTLSYVYYLDTGKRVPQVINNIWEIINFICIEEMRAKKIIFYGKVGMDYNDKRQLEKDLKKNQEIVDLRVSFLDSHVFRGIPHLNIIKGTFFIELFNQTDNPKRMGGLGTNRESKFSDYKFFRPEIYIQLNNKFFFSYKDGVNSYNARLLVNESNGLCMSV